MYHYNIFNITNSISDFSTGILRNLFLLDLASCILSTTATEHNQIELYWFDFNIGFPTYYRITRKEHGEVKPLNWIKVYLLNIPWPHLIPQNYHRSSTSSLRWLYVMFNLTLLAPSVSDARQSIFLHIVKFVTYGYNIIDLLCHLKVSDRLVLLIVNIKFLPNVSANACRNMVIMLRHFFVSRMERIGSKSNSPGNFILLLF